MLEITKKWVIGADSFNITVFRKMTPRKEGSEPYLSAIGYFSTLHHALKGLVEQDIRDTKLASLQVLTDRLDELYSVISSLKNITVDDLREKE